MDQLPPIYPVLNLTDLINIICNSIRGSKSHTHYRITLEQYFKKFKNSALQSKQAKLSYFLKTISKN